MQSKLIFTHETEISRLITATLYSPILGMDWNYNLYWPKSSSLSSNEQLPLLIMLHGILGNSRNFLERFDSQKMLDDLIAAHGTKMIVVFADGFNTFYVNQKGGLQMENAIINDLLPFIMSHYPVSQDSRFHAIGGISMGGYGAARFALKYPHVFQNSLLISPAIWSTLDRKNPIRQTMHAFCNQNTNWSDAVYQRLFPTKYISPKQSASLKFFVESSCLDKTVPIADVTKFVDTLQQNQISVLFKKDANGGHTWPYWQEAVPHAYSWLSSSLKK